MPDPSLLTDRQAEVYGFIRRRIGNGCAPTFRQLMDDMKFKSPNAVMGHLDALERKGFIKRAFNQSRSIEIVGAKEALDGLIAAAYAVADEFESDDPAFVRFREAVERHRGQG